MSNERRPHLRLEFFVGFFLVVTAAACSPNAKDEVDAGAPSPPASIVTTTSAAPPPEPPPAAPTVKPTLKLLAAGDVSFGRLVGQMLLRDPDLALFASMDPLFRAVDVRFVNLEGPISDRGTETVSPHNNLVFNGPPASARVLSRAQIDIVSTANNHAWDYGQKGLLETLEWLDKEKVLHVGAGRTIEKAWEPRIIERSGFRLAFVAVNDIWNQPHVPGHSARDHVAPANRDDVVRIVRELRKKTDIDAIAVSHHGGVEYQDEPLPRTKELAVAAIDAGADVFIGHHPHVVQGLAFHAKRPIVYSLGNLLMRMTSAHPETEMGLAVRIEFERGGAPKVFACPVRIFGIDPIPLAKDPERKAYEPRFIQRLRSVTHRVGTAIVGPVGEDGCASVDPSPNLP